MKTEKEIRNKLDELDKELISIHDDIQSKGSYSKYTGYLIDKAYETQACIDMLEWVLN